MHAFFRRDAAWTAVYLFPQALGDHLSLVVAKSAPFKMPCQAFLTSLPCSSFPEQTRCAGLCSGSRQICLRPFPADAGRSPEPRRRKVRTVQNALPGISHSAPLLLLSGADPLRWALLRFPPQAAGFVRLDRLRPSPAGAGRSPGPPSRRRRPPGPGRG